jgi:4-oxalocrotonate tautomerase
MESMMPLIKITLSGVPVDAEANVVLQAETTALMAKLLGKRREVTVVAIDHRPGAALAVAGRPATGGGAFMEAFITAGSNDAGQLANFIAAAHALLRSVVGEGELPIYVVVGELPATAWGYDGQTQAARRLAAQPL